MSVFIPIFQKMLPHYARRAAYLGGGLTAFHPTVLPAGGTVQTGLRDYSPGDPLSRVDWGICARHDELRVREFRGQAARYAYLLLDTSRSMQVDAAKFTLARQAGMTLAYTLLSQNAHVAIGCWAETLSRMLLPVLGMTRVGRAMKFLEETGVDDKTTDFPASAQAFVRLRQPRGQVFVLSDFFGRTDSFRENYEAGLIHLQAAGYQPRVVHLTSPHDRGEGIHGDVQIVDMESGYTQAITLTERDIQAYQTLFDAYLHSVEAFCRSRRILYTRVATDMTQNTACLAALGIPCERK